MNPFTPFKRRTSRQPVRRHSGRHRLPPQVELLEDRTVPAVLTVNSLGDTLKLTDDVVTLRDAIEAANKDLQVSPGGPTGSGADEIRFQSGLRGTISTVTNFDITSDLSIAGPGANFLTISHVVTEHNGGARASVFSVASAEISTVVISGLTITGGQATDWFGGGIYNAGNLTIQDCIVTGNRAEHAGGGIYNHAVGTLTILNSTISANFAERGSGIYNDGLLTSILNVPPPLLTAQKSTISDNTSIFLGGGVANTDGTLTVQNSTISGNKTAGEGGASTTLCSIPVR